MPLSRLDRLANAAEIQARFATLTRRFAPGALGGRTESASPVVRERPPAPARPRVAPQIPPFSFGSAATAVAVSASGKWYPSAALRIVQVLASLVTAGTTTTTVAIRKNGVSLGTISFLSGEVGPKTLTLATDLGTADALTVAVTAAGSSAAGLVVEPRSS